MIRTVELAPTPRSVRTARVFTADALGEEGIAASVIELCVLLVSELVTNAISHARSSIHVAVHIDSHWVRVEVEDTGPGDPIMQPSTPNDLAGRGLAVVDRLSTEWGNDQREDGKVVWFEIAR
jgi:anti-sigma regulatory factor (Ser/Thr protein kinase)